MHIFCDDSKYVEYKIKYTLRNFAGHADRMADEKNTKTDCTVQNERTCVPRKTLLKMKWVCEIEQASFLTALFDS